jgi:hypothetical protein
MINEAIFSAIRWNEADGRAENFTKVTLNPHPLQKNGTKHAAASSIFLSKTSMGSKEIRPLPK